MYLSCSTLCFDARVYPDMRQVLHRIADLGFNAVDIAAFENWQHINPSTLAADGFAWLEMLESSLVEMDLRVSSINAGLSVQIDDPDFAAFVAYRREFESVLDLADRVHASHLTIQPGRPFEGYAHRELFELTQAHLAALAPIAKAHDTTLSVEGHQGSLLEDPEDALQMMEALWPDVGFTYDPSHWVMQGIPLEATEPLLRYAHHVHVRNAVPGAMRATMDEGNVDFAWLIEALRDYGYDGAVTIEYFNNFDPEFESVRALRDRLLALGVRP